MKFISVLLLSVLAACGRSETQGSDPVAETKSEDQTVVEAQQAASPAEIPSEPQHEFEAPQETKDIVLELDASSSTEAAYFKWENDTLSRTTSDQTWMFAVKRTQFQTNSGTSGNLDFGATNMNTTDYGSVTECLIGVPSYDEMLPASGAPGSQPFSGNAALNQWYDYDGATHGLTSKKLVYLISNGASCVKFQIESYRSGVYSVRADILPVPGSH